jgi:hypothetical protein
VDLIEPVKVVVGHDASAGQGWYLEKVVITSENALVPDDDASAPQNEKLYTFLCQRSVEKQFDIMHLLLNAIFIFTSASDRIAMCQLAPFVLKWLAPLLCRSCLLCAG